MAMIGMDRNLVMAVERRERMAPAFSRSFSFCASPFRSADGKCVNLFQDKVPRPRVSGVRDVRDVSVVRGVRDVSNVRGVFANAQCPIKNITTPNAEHGCGSPSLKTGVGSSAGVSGCGCSGEDILEFVDKVDSFIVIALAVFV